MQTKLEVMQVFIYKSPSVAVSSLHHSDEW